MLGTFSSGQRSFSAADTTYLVGPYRELLATLRKGQGARQPEVS